MRITYATALTLLVASGAHPTCAGGTGIGSVRALLFAGSNNSDDAALRERGTLAIHHQLTASGVPAENIRVVHGGADTSRNALLQAISQTAGTAGTDDTLIVFVAASAGPDAASLQAGTDRVSLQQLVNAMFVSPSRKRCLLVDAGSTRPTDLSGFGRSKRLQLPQNQWLAISRTSRRERQADGTQTTAFAAAIASALGGCGDIHGGGATSGDGRLTILELTEYLNNYAASFGFAAPAITGKTTGDGTLMLVSINSALGRIPTDMRNRQADLLQETAATALLENRNPDYATEALDNAAQLREADSTRHLIVTAQATRAELRSNPQALLSAIDRAATAGNQLEIQFMGLGYEELRIQRPGVKDAAAVLNPGDLLGVKGHVRYQGKTWLKVQSARRREYEATDDQVRAVFREIPGVAGCFVQLGYLLPNPAPRSGSGRARPTQSKVATFR